MKTSLRIVIALALVAMIVVLGMAPSQSIVSAQTGGGYDLTWNSYDSGGVIRSSGGTYLLNGSTGQHDASSRLRAGVYALDGGFWTGIQPYYDVSLPLARR